MPRTIQPQCPAPCMTQGARVTPRGQAPSDATRAGPEPMLRGGGASQCHKGRTTGAQVQCYEGQTTGAQAQCYKGQARAQCCKGQSPGQRGPKRNATWAGPKRDVTRASLPNDKAQALCYEGRTTGAQAHLYKGQGRARCNEGPTPGQRGPARHAARARPERARCCKCLSPGQQLSERNATRAGLPDDRARAYCFEGWKTGGRAQCYEGQA